MEKNRAKEIIASAYDSIIEKLHKQEAYDNKAIIDELHNLAKALQEESSQNINLYSPEKTFEEEYKALAHESIESYAQTKESVERINEEQKRILKSSTEDKDKKVSTIMSSFSDLHFQVEDQMKEANETIESLYKQINVLEKSSNLDSLTRTFNRRAMDKYLSTLCNMKGRTPQSTILLVDIDDFKLVNDTHGHLAGDRVLIFLAKLVNTILREGDKVFRFGGEEFLILLNRCDGKAAQNISRRILEGVRSNSLLYKNDQIKITLSIGSAELQAKDTFESYIDRADKALYRAKNNGKDQFVAG